MPFTRIQTLLVLGLPKATMAIGRESDAVDEHPPQERDTPEIAACESSPERVVFLESGNNDAWIASDVIVDVEE